MKIQKISLAISLLLVAGISQAQLLNTTVPIDNLAGIEVQTSSALHGGNLHIGEPLPDFKLQTPDGVVFTKDNIKGKVVLLDFWATWCAPCRKLTAEIDSTLRLYQGRDDFQMIGVLYREDVVKKKTDPEGYWKEHGYGFSMTLNDNELGNAVNAANPTVLLIDKEGVIRGRWDAWTPSTHEEITSFTKIALDQKTVQQQDIRAARDRGAYYEASLLLSKYQYQFEQAQLQLLKDQFDLLLEMKNRAEATQLLKRELLFAKDWKLLYALFTEQQPQNTIVSPQDAYVAILKLHNLSDDVFMYSTLAKKLHNQGHRALATQVLEEGLSTLKSGDDMMKGMFENQLKTYRNTDAQN